MASWMVHLRIADKLLDKLPALSPVEFIMGNMAPDSGVPNEDWSKFTPSTQVSHFRVDDGNGKKKMDLEAFLSRWFTPELQSHYDEKAYSFFLGYYTHLLTDCLWSEKIAEPTQRRLALQFAADRSGTWEKVKGDWYDLDYLYLKKHPGFRAFRVYLGAVGFRNTYMDIFSEDALDNRRAYITDFYLQKNDHLDREYPYLTEAEADRFVEDAAASIRISLGKLSIL